MLPCQGNRLIHVLLLTGSQVKQGLANLAEGTDITAFSLGGLGRFIGFSQAARFLLLIEFSVGILNELLQLAALVIRQDTAACGELALLEPHHDHAAHAGGEEHLWRRDHDSPGELRKGLDHSGGHGCFQHGAKVMKRQRLVRDKDGNRIQKLIDGCPDLAVAVDSQIIALLSENILLSEKTVINPGVGNESEQHRRCLSAGAALL